MIDRIKGWIQRLSPAPDDEFWYSDVSGASTFTGRAVNSQTALQCVAVYACVNLISQSVASLPFNVYRRLPNGGKEIAPDHPVHSIIHTSPNEELTAVEFWETSVAHILTCGNSFARVHMIGPRRDIERLELLNPVLMSVERDRETGVRFYRYRPEGKSEQIIFDDEMLHIPGLGYDGLIGYNPVTMLRNSIAVSLAQEEWQGRFFGNNATPPAYISVPNALGPDAYKRLKEHWEQRHRGLANAHKIAILEQGAELKSVSISQKDMEFLAMRKFQLEEIARIFRVPLHMIQNLDKATFSNIEHQGIDFASYTIRPWLAKIEKRVHKALFGSREAVNFFPEFNMDGLLRADAASRAKFYASMVQNAGMTPNEVRAKENLNPMPGGDSLYIQGATVPLEMAGKLQGAAPVDDEDDEDEDRDDMKMSAEASV